MTSKKEEESSQKRRITGERMNSESKDMREEGKTIERKTEGIKKERDMSIRETSSYETT